MLKPYFHLYLAFLFRQLNNDDANDDSNDIDIFPRKNKHRTYKISQTKQFLWHESIRIANYGFSSTLSCNIFTFYFDFNIIKHTLLKEATWNGGINFLKIKKTYSDLQFEKNMLRNGFSAFKLPNSQKAILCVLF